MDIIVHDDSNLCIQNIQKKYKTQYSSNIEQIWNNLLFISNGTIDNELS